MARGGEGPLPAAIWANDTKGCTYAVRDTALPSDRKRSMPLFRRPISLTCLNEASRLGGFGVRIGDRGPHGLLLTANKNYTSGPGKTLHLE